MANQRASDQKAVLVMFSERFLETIDRNLSRMGFSDRASFIRQAAKEKLDRSGIVVAAEDTLAPARTGKGGPRRKILPMVLENRVAEGDEPGDLPDRKPVKYTKR